ncbi:MAG: glycosyltransferase family 2 protein, partial [Bacteroidales bacterium]|nr:glycosyltransferase family 2 protein [Bacteroidales bacterium]
MFSLIICTYNRDKFLYDTLLHVVANNFPTDNYEIVLVNNNSTDNTEQECERFKADFPDAQFRYFVETKQGLSHARNRGIIESRGDVLVFLDDDSFVKPDYLRNLQKQMDDHPEAMAFGGKITPRFETGETPKWLCKWTYSWVSAIDKGDGVVLFEGSSYPIGANMGFRKECLKQCGNFNTELGRTKKNLMGGEEKDIFNRVKAQNMLIFYFPDIQV